MLKLRDVYELAVEAGIRADLRPKEEIDRLLDGERRKWEKMEAGDKARFDKDRLTNPFADCRILHGDPETEVKGALVGIDIGPGEVLLADRLRQTGKTIDLIISHHPAGRALAGLGNVMGVQADLWSQHGVPIAQAEGLLGPRAKEVALSVGAANHNRAVDAARLLDFPFMCIHTPGDNCVVNFLNEKLKSTKPYLLGDILEMLLEVEEYSRYASQVAAPTIVVGSKESRAGEVFVDMTGGTSGPRDIYEIVAKSSSVSTLLCMHVSQEHKKAIEKQHLNCIVAPHMPSDTLGLNLVFDHCETKGEISFVECSGFCRVRRN